jgi:hypothetical protein
MGAMPVVAVKPDGQFGGAVLRGAVRPGVGPFAQAGLDEALGLAVGVNGAAIFLKSGAAKFPSLAGLGDQPLA